MSRRLAREWCMKILYQMSIQGDYNLNVLDFYKEKFKNPQTEYVHTVMESVTNNLSKIDKIIESYSEGWKLNRIAKVDLAILRLALGEILYVKDIPYRVSINEAIELAKIYGADESTSFINGILGTFIEKEGIKNEH